MTKVVGGAGPEGGRLASLFFESVAPGKVHSVSSARSAEMAKLLENTFRSVNIALVNELAMLAERMGLDIWEVIDAASTKPFGFMPFYPGASCAALRARTPGVRMPSSSWASASRKREASQRMM